MNLLCKSAPRSAKLPLYVIPGRVYLPTLFNRRNAGYGVRSFGEGSIIEGVCELEVGIMRLGVLPAGVTKGVLEALVLTVLRLTDDAVADRVLSLLRERFEDEGEAGTASGPVDMSPVSVLRRRLSLALRLRSRSFCSLKV